MLYTRRPANAMPYVTMLTVLVMYEGDSLAEVKDNPSSLLDIRLSAPVNTRQTARKHLSSKRLRAICVLIDTKCPPRVWQKSSHVGKSLATIVATFCPLARMSILA